MAGCSWRHPQDDEWRRCGRRLYVSGTHIADDPRFTDGRRARRGRRGDGERHRRVAPSTSRQTNGQPVGRAGVAGAGAPPTDRRRRVLRQRPAIARNDVLARVNATRFGVHRRWGPVVRVNGGLSHYGPGALGRRAPPTPLSPVWERTARRDREARAVRRRREPSLDVDLARRAPTRLSVPASVAHFVVRDSVAAGHRGASPR